MSCRLDLCKFYVVDAIINRIISHLKFPPLGQNLSPKCKQTGKKTKSQIHVVNRLCCSIWTGFGSRLSSNIRIYTAECSTTNYTTPITPLLTTQRLYTNDIILTNHRVSTTLTLNIKHITPPWRRNTIFTPPTIFPFDTPNIKPGVVTER